MNKNISRLLDDDLSPDETLTLLQKIKEQPELKDTLNRYAAISHALKTDNFLWVSDDFHTRIQQEIQQMPVAELSAMNKTVELLAKNYPRKTRKITQHDFIFSTSNVS